MSPTADTTHRLQFITGLRELADLLTGNPGIPVARHGDTLTVVMNSTEEGGCAQVRHAAQLLGVTVTDETGHGGHFYAEKSFGTFTYRVVSIPEISMARYYALWSYAGSVDPPPQHPNRPLTHKRQPAPKERSVPITILDYVKSQIGERDSYSAEDFYKTGVDITGGCEICGAALAGYNAYPSTSGYWRCADCIDTSGYATVEAFSTASGQDGFYPADEETLLDCPDCGAVENIREVGEHTFNCGTCGSTWQL